MCSYNNNSSSRNSSITLISSRIRARRPTEHIGIIMNGTGKSRHWSIGPDKDIHRGKHVVGYSNIVHT